ncbi:NAD(P)-dependent alcohol dehydrogenase [Pseudactinotalea sp. Z1748]|uniref:NAD(P)-dependent alcohol dehydrogenase n=1 Tax=Pseudactinotalea sp. Z1748 TaxID=3413027 RepID=UPI003C7D18B2
MNTATGRTTTVPRTMRAAVLHRVRELHLEEWPVPGPGPHEVLIRVHTVGLCGSDVHFYEHGRVGDLEVLEPLVLGHEAAGTIVAAGEQVGGPDSLIGRRVAIEPQRPCRYCWHCRTGQYNLCPQMQFLSAPPVHGCFAEYVTVPADLAHPVPEQYSDDAVALLEPLSVGIAAARKAAVVPGSRVLVAGAGPIGVLCAAAARGFGATDVVVADPVQPRREIAQDMGATEVFDPLTQTAPDGAFDAFIDASGAPGVLAAGLRALRGGGRAVLVGMAAEEVALNVFLVQSRELKIEGLFRYTDTWPAAIALAADLDLDRLVSARFPLESLGEAIHRNGEAEVMKVLVDVAPDPS